jgi:hypothetical protein
VKGTLRHEFGPDLKQSASKRIAENGVASSLMIEHIPNPSDDFGCVGACRAEAFGVGGFGV